jgi:zinc protease
LPPLRHERLSNGLELTLLRRGGVPLVTVELVIPRGRDQDGSRSGAALVCSELMRERMARSVGSLGDAPELEVELDRTRFSYTVAASELASTLGRLGTIGAARTVSPAEFARVRQRLVDDAVFREERDTARTVRAYLYFRLFQLPAGQHPYAATEATTADLGALKPEDCARHFGQAFTPVGAVLSAVGDFEPEDVVAQATARFARWQGVAHGRSPSTPPLPPIRLEVALLDRPGAKESVMALGTLGPERSAPEMPALSVALELLRTRAVDASLRAHLGGPSLVALVTTAPLDATPREVKSLLETLEALKRRGPGEEETRTAVRALADGFWVRAETNQALAHLLAMTTLSGLEDDTWDRDRSALHDVEPRDVKRAAMLHLAENRMLLVVSGVAARLARPLSHFGPVDVIRPKTSLVERSLARDPTVPLEVPAPSEL